MYLYERYQTKLRWLAKNKDTSEPIEKMLWHGTKENSVNGITKNGFTKLYMGDQGVVTVIQLIFLQP